VAILKFERGEAEFPAGHAFLYFPGTGDQVLATYLVVLPVPIDLAKYVPPLLASGLGSSGLLAQTSFLPVPPVPDAFSLVELRRLADLRGDDILVERTPIGIDLPSLMARVAEIGDAYTRSYQDGLGRRPKPEPARRDENALEGLALLYSTLTERERLEELARRVGTLRYALDGGDRALADTTRGEMRAIALYLPEKYRSEEMIEAASATDACGPRLVQLYIERGYKLCTDDFGGIPAIEAEIATLQQDRP
jgi:hypothetical protein